LNKGYVSQIQGYYREIFMLIQQRRTGVYLLVYVQGVGVADMRDEGHEEGQQEDEEEQ
jgi:hypothetical protein